MILERFPNNPLISPEDVVPSYPDWEVTGAYNCGAFCYEDRIGLLVRITERPINKDPQIVVAPVLEFPNGSAHMVVKAWPRSAVNVSDPRFVEAETRYDAIHSHLRLAWSDDGYHFQVDDKPTITGQREWEAFGIHDPRVLYIDGQWTIIYSGGGHVGMVMSLATTQDWRTFDYKGIIFPPDNKDVCLFPEKINGRYCCIHRPSGVYFGGNDMWLAYSDDLLHWGSHQPLAQRRPGMWDSSRIGCGPEPIRTSEGWLELYHGSDDTCYYLGAILLDLQDPSKVIARSDSPLLQPEADYEKHGFYDNVVFPHGLVRRDDDRYFLYYGGADKYTCGCEISISGILNSLR